MLSDDCEIRAKNTLNDLISKYPTKIIDSVELKFNATNDSRVIIDYESGKATISINPKDCYCVESIVTHEYMHICLFDKTKNTFFARIIYYERASRIIEDMFFNTVGVDYVFYVIQDIILMMYIRSLDDAQVIDSQRKIFREAIEAILKRIRNPRSIYKEFPDGLGVYLWGMIFIVITAHIFENWASNDEIREILNFWRKLSRDPTTDPKFKVLISAMLMAIRELIRELPEFLDVVPTEEHWFNVLDLLVDTLINMPAKKLGVRGEIAFYVEKTKIRGFEITKVSITATK